MVPRLSPKLPSVPVYCRSIYLFLSADVFPFYAELQTDTDKGVFSNKVKLFSASESASNTWDKTYYKLNHTSLLMETTEV